MDDSELDRERDLANDKVIQNLKELIKKIEKDSQKASSDSVVLMKDLKSSNSEIESYNR